MAPPPARPPLDRIAVYITLFQSSPVSTWRGKILSHRLILCKVFPKSSWQAPERLWAARWWWSRSLRLGCPRGSSAGRRKTEENVDCQRDDGDDDCATCIPSRAKMKMKRKRRRRRDMMEDKAFISAITRFRSGDQYLKMGGQQKFRKRSKLQNWLWTRESLEAAAQHQSINFAMPFTFDLGHMLAKGHTCLFREFESLVQQKHWGEAFGKQQPVLRSAFSAHFVTLKTLRRRSARRPERPKEPARGMKFTQNTWKHITDNNRRNKNHHKESFSGVKTISRD